MINYQNILSNFLKLSNRLAFDLGAYDGKDTVFLVKNGYKVVSVEANPTRCLAKLKPLAWIYKQVAVENICISDKAGTTDFYLSQTFGVWDSCNIEISQRKQKCKQKITMPCTTVIDLIRKYDIPEYIKCDIEGNDILVLKSLLSTDLRPKYISCESECQGNNYDESKKYEVLDCMKLLGYDMFFLVDCQKECQNQLTVLPDNISSWISYEEMKSKMEELSQEYQEKYQTRQLWCDLYCTSNSQVMSY